MSLLRRLLLSVSVAIVAILLGTLALSIGAARQYLDGQLQSQSENAVSALALSLSQPANQDPVTRELLMMALFDSGQFRSIRLTGTQGQTLFERAHPAAHSSSAAPQWFSDALPLATPVGERVISNGWQQVGKLTVVVDSAFARDALWSSAVRTTLLVVGAGALWALFVMGLVQWFRKVLHEEVESQVLNIGNEQEPAAVSVAQGSRVAELAMVSSAIRSTSVRVHASAKEQTQRIEVLELETNSDAVTQLPNRKYFVNELQKALQSDDTAQGHVLMVRQRDLQALNASVPRHQVDEWLHSVWQQVRTLLAEQAQLHAQLARLNGSDFVVMLPGDLGPQDMQVVQQLRKLLQSLSLGWGQGRWSRWAFALTAYGRGDSVAQVLTRLDQGLMQAESAGHGDVEYVEQHILDGQEQAATAGHWQSLLAHALQTPQALRIAVQAVHSRAAGAPQLRHEASLELCRADGQVLGGALFLPAVVRLGLSAQYDLKAIELGLQWLASHAGQPLVVRVSVPSLEHEGFVPGLQQLLQAAQAQPGGQGVGCLILELDAHALELSPELVAEVEHVLTAAGAGMGLRRLDQAPKALVHLAGLPLRYVKLGGHTVEKALTNDGMRFLLQAMVHTAHARAARVYISEAVSPEASNWLRGQDVFVQEVQGT